MCIRKLLNILSDYKKQDIRYLHEYVSTKTKELTIDYLHIINLHNQKIKHFELICSNIMPDPESYL